jgi:hypothetical protein
MQNPLAKLILESLKKAEGYLLPESTMKTQMRNMVVPPADDEDFANAFILLLERDYIGFNRDGVNDERKFFLKSKGEAYAATL